MRTIPSFIIDPTKPEKALRDLNSFQEKVRAALNEKRTVLNSVDPALEPPEGELALIEGEVYLASGGEYKKLIPDPETLPAWFLEHLKVREEMLRASGVPEEEWPYVSGF